MVQEMATAPLLPNMLPRPQGTLEDCTSLTRGANCEGEASVFSHKHTMGQESVSWS